MVPTGPTEMMFVANRFNRASIALPVEGNSGMDLGDRADPTHPSLLPISLRAAASQPWQDAAGAQPFDAQPEERVGVQLPVSGQVVVNNFTEGHPAYFALVLHGAFIDWHRPCSWSLLSA